MRGDRSSIEPHVASRFPGAIGAFAFFAEVLLTGALIALVGLPLITLPAAIAAGVRHLRCYARAEDSRLTLFWHDVRRAILPGIAFGAAALSAALFLLVDILLLRTHDIPGRVLVEAVAWAGLLLLASCVLRSTALWSPTRGWLGALRLVPAHTLRDSSGTLYLASAAALGAILTWLVPPLLLPALGCAALAALAVQARASQRLQHRRQREDLPSRSQAGAALH